MFFGEVRFVFLILVVDCYGSLQMQLDIWTSGTMNVVFIVFLPFVDRNEKEDDKSQ